MINYLRHTHNKPFLILTDENMPGVNGLELREEIIKDDILRRKSIPFVFLSTSDGSQIINRCTTCRCKGIFKNKLLFRKSKSKSN